ncbi:MAG TPA: penicillin-binding protein 2 [Flavipsychrobacter sp.]|nr:penicillin-binding protein 2 [Flavipsychrobacter sp.]
MSVAVNPRQLIVKLIFISTAVVILMRLLFLQLFEDKYKVMADDIAIYKKVVYPPRGTILDRKGKTMLYNRLAFDLIVTPNKVGKNLDTAELCTALGIDIGQFNKLLQKAIIKNGYRRPGTFIEQLSDEQTARFKENMYLFDGFELLERSIREYPNPSAGLLLGYVGEVSPAMLKRDRYASYTQGDYVGMSGLENGYEEVLRGTRGVYYYERDNYNRLTESYKKGQMDTQAVAGKALQLYLDAEIQEYVEKLMKNMVGSAVAIDPKTGGIICMVSAPSYDPNLLRGRERSKNYAALNNDYKKPLFNRATQAYYPPGSTMKPMTALIALDVGVITPSYGYPCGGGYYACGKRIGCTHSGGGHAANLRLAIANSCNSYFVHIMRLIEDAKKFGNVKKGLQAWHDYCWNFGFGHPTGIDIPYENGGIVPDSTRYNRMYGGSWNSCTNLFVGMGQGEISLTPVQMANAMCIIANHGYYYTPHFVKSIGGNPRDSILAPYLKRHKVTSISDSSFAVVALGMQDVVTHGTGKVAQLPNINICAKTGTVENKAAIDGVAVKMQNHSAFVAFAPRENPTIAVAVMIENAGYGATWAGPIASLIIEKYLTDSISSKRKYLETKLMNANLINPYLPKIEAAQRYKDSLRYETRIANKRQEERDQYVRDSIIIRRYFENMYGKKLP